MEGVLLLLHTAVFLTTCIDNAAMQSVSWELKTENPKCETTIELTCTISGFSTCCSAFPRLWRKLSGGVTSDLVVDGVSSDASKYREELNEAAYQTTLVIKNFNQDSDVTGIEYICSYGGLTESKPIVLTGEKDCGQCAANDFGYSMIGTAVMAFIFLVIFALYYNSHEKENWFAVIIFVIALVVGAIINIPIAVSVGFAACHCLCQSEVTYAFIAVGAVTASIVALVVHYKRKKIKKIWGNTSNADYEMNRNQN